MTQYGGEDLDGWEFKIVRSATSKFKSPDYVRRLCEEEARAGWEMVEKFDDHRIRFKRRVERRAEDAHLGTALARLLVDLGVARAALARAAPAQ